MHRLLFICALSLMGCELLSETRAPDPIPTTPDMAGEMTLEVRDMAPDVPPDLPRDMPRDLPRDMPRDVPQDLPEDLPVDLPVDLPPEMDEAPDVVDMPPEMDVAPDMPVISRVTDELVLYFPLVEGAGTRTSSLGSVSGELEFQGPVAWNNGVNGVTIFEGGSLKLVGSPTMIYNALLSNQSDPMATDAFSLEIWVEAANTTQAGPARMISMSGSTSQRNTTLGAERTDIGFRVRTDDPYMQTNSEGMMYNARLNGLPTEYGIGHVNTQLAHYIATYDEATSKMKVYHDGQLVMDVTRPGTLSNWERSMSLYIGRESGSTRFWAGRVYQVAVYGKALDAAEVQQNFAAGHLASP